VQCKNKIAPCNRKFCHLHSKTSKSKLLKQTVGFAKAKKKFNTLSKSTQQADIFTLGCFQWKNRLSEKYNQRKQ
jgi:hypothetical protein